MILRAEAGFAAPGDANETAVRHRLFRRCRGLFLNKELSRLILSAEG